MTCGMDVLTTFGRKEGTGPTLHPGQRHSKAKELPCQGASVKRESDKAAETGVKHLTKCKYWEHLEHWARYVDLEPPWKAGKAIPGCRNVRGCRELGQLIL